MALFGKKEKEARLPELPRLPEIPDIEDEEFRPHQLPRFPNDSLGEKFSQNTIKEAITGRKEETEADADEFMEEEETQMMHEPQARLSRESSREKILRRTRESGPIFIRIDKFEESLNNFEQIKKQIAEIERILEQIKKVKEQEELELQSWEGEIQSVKKQIEKIDYDIFSKIG